MATRQETENGSAVMRFGPFTVDGQSGELHKGSTRLKVPDQSIAVLQALLSVRASLSPARRCAHGSGPPTPLSTSKRA